MPPTIPQNYGGVVILRRKITEVGVRSAAKVLRYLLFANSVALWLQNHWMCMSGLGFA